MDQVVQLQQQLQRLQQEISGISQVCNQLQQSEQTNAIQLQQMTQKEFLASQGLRRIQQAANQLSQEVNQISNITSQIVSQVLPVQRALQTTGVIPGTYALTSQIPGNRFLRMEFIETAFIPVKCAPVNRPCSSR